MASHPSRGFSLLELSIALLAVGLMTAFALQIRSTNQSESCNTATKVQLTTIQAALERFARTNDRLPLPSSRVVGVEDPSYGREPVTAGDITAALLDTAAGVSYGALPFQTLGLSQAFAGDCWGHKYTYAVTTALTSNAASGGYLDPAVLGAITVKGDSTTPLNTNIAYAVISHGADGLGAVATNYRDATNKKWCTSSAVLQTTNCAKSTSGAPAADFSTVIAAKFNDGTASTTTFDDVVIYNGKVQLPTTPDECPLCWFMYFLASQ